MQVSCWIVVAVLIKTVSEEGNINYEKIHSKQATQCEKIQEKYQQDKSSESKLANEGRLEALK